MIVRCLFYDEGQHKNLEKQLRSEKMSEEIHGVNKVMEESLALVIDSVFLVDQVMQPINPTPAFRPSVYPEPILLSTASPIKNTYVDSLPEVTTAPNFGPCVDSRTHPTEK
jgi:hypothetical protein